MQSDERRIGSNRLIVQDDLVYIVESRLWDRAEVEEICALFTSVIAQAGRVYLLVVGSERARVTVEGRRVFADWSRDHQLDGVLIHGAGPVLRAVTALVFRAAAVIRGSSMRVTFTNTESEARQRLDELRASHRR